MDPITIQKLNQYDISFAKSSDGRKFVNGNSTLTGYIAVWEYMSTPKDIADFIGDINRCINGQYDYNSEDVTAYSIHTYQVELKPQGLFFYHLDSNFVVIDTDVYPYDDIKIILTALKEFMES